MVKSVPPEPVRRRTFFRSTISIQPRQDSPANPANQASSTTVLAALSPPKESTPIPKQSKKSNPATATAPATATTSKTNDDTMHTADDAADVKANAKESSGPSTRNERDAGKKTSSSGQTNDPKTLAIGLPKIQARVSRLQPDAAAAATPSMKTSTTAMTMTTTRGSSIAHPNPESSKKQTPVKRNAGIFRSRISWAGTRERDKNERKFDPDENGNGNAVASSSSARPGSANTQGPARPSTPPRPFWKTANRTESNKHSGDEKRYMEAGFYCQDDYAKSPLKLVSKVLLRRQAELDLNKKAAKGKKGKVNGGPPEIPPHVKLDHNRPVFPPLPYDYGYELFFGEEHDFVLPFNIRTQAEQGLLDGKKKPAPYSKLRANVFPERTRTKAPFAAVCGCKPNSGCRDDCINEKMHYLCGKDCPSGESCTNQSLSKRKTPKIKIHYTGSRGFGLVAEEDIEEGDFVIDYRGEIIGLDSYQDRCQTDYSSSRNFYALAYDLDEVIDAGVRGNEARFINHSCNPNLIVQRFQSLGDGWEEYEVGMWANRDIAAGEELTYDYNFDAFGVSEGAKRVECKCGASNCVGYLGRKSGEKTSKQIALENEAKEAAKTKVAKIKAKRAAKETDPSASRPATGRTQSEPTAAKAKPSRISFTSTGTAGSSISSSQVKKGRVSDAPPPVSTGLTIGGVPLAAKMVDTLTERPPRYAPKGRASASTSSPVIDTDDIAIPPPVDFYRNESSAAASSNPTKTTGNPGKGRRSLPAKQGAGSSSHQATAKQESREVSPVPLFVPHKRKRARESAPAAVERPVSEPISSPEKPPRNDGSEQGETSPKKPRPAGWAGWFRKKAGERPRTLEDWVRERETHKRGPGWLRDMMDEFGSLPGPGHPGQVGSVVSAELLEAKRKEALEAGIRIYPDEAKDIKAARKAAKKKARQTDPGPGSGSQAGPSTDTNAPAPPSGHDTETESRGPRESTPAREARIRAKAESIKKRNGAPMGWAYLPVGVERPIVAPARFRVHENLPRSSRRRSSVSYHGAQ